MRTRTCLRFPGGKFYGWTKLKDVVDTPHKEYREVMVGGGSIFLGKQLSEHNWINDVDRNLINFYKIIQNNSDRKRLFKLLNGSKATKTIHAMMRDNKPKDKFESAYKFFYLNRTSFSGIMSNPRWGYLIGSSTRPERWADIIKPVAQKLKKVKITCQDFRNVINESSSYKNKDVLLYVDPPYYKAAKNIYTNDFSKNDHIDLARMLKRTRFKFVLSYDNVDEIRELYSWAIVKDSTWTYFMSENRRQIGKELIITNFD